MNPLLARWLWLFPPFGAVARPPGAILRRLLADDAPVPEAAPLNDHLRYDCGLSDCRPRRRADHEGSEPFT
ncbi:hypothetical protein [Acidisoma sp. 7E03]